MALLIINPSATSTTPSTRLVLQRALRSAFDLEVIETAHRGQGAEIARNCDHELIIVHGGDGTVNDVASGLIDFTTGQSHGKRLAIVPGGSTNVFARAIGIASDPVEATAQLLAAEEKGATRTVSIGGLTLDGQPERTFLFAAGLGVDGHTVELVEKMRRSFSSTPRGISPTRYSMAALTAISRYIRADHQLAITADGATFSAAVAIATTNRTWTYLGSRPLSITPEATFDTGLGLFTMDRLTTAQALAVIASLARTGVASASGVRHRANLTTVELSSARPLPVQADGEALPPTQRMVVRSLPGALTVALP